ncbi:MULTISPECIES: hypothetical protein [unclassified Streptomyces]|uniref:hypothetical protein n=1 Tax=unclassified Streptomyces TaxID=2593676 RepID=UPI00131D2B87|nr:MULTISPECIES: hypothetical protein [unclassified Streptomyces]WSF82405.1 hypothetical protein OIE70_04220 [Streptomyces sp. NBC_01744]WSC41301.1 hypothetical protein OHA08_40860 [Streptomyces sp. NBC_01763]WSC49689.1 hypothetical protein OIE61_40580 [Streptomyces sp. NBC_01762]WSC51555.1 hypothetical protein OG808_04080 [Streptomyces sp. NBC_01761]WSD29266.1 hypothetical protein OHA26_40930 [Streptomyces sp. NBC_01751]
MDIAGAELLARLLAEHDHLPAALGVGEQRLRLFVTRHQRALRMRPFFMPAHRFGYAARRTLIRAANTPVGSALTKSLLN